MYRNVTFDLGDLLEYLAKVVVERETAQKEVAQLRIELHVANSSRWRDELQAETEGGK